MIEIPFLLLINLLRGDVCFDVGANIGAISFALAKKVFPHGRVFSFEPGEYLYKRFEYNLSLNPKFRETIKIFQKGFSDKEEILYWKKDKENEGNAMFLEEKEDDTVPIKLVTMDLFVKENPLEKLDFIKIDVEGMEFEVIKGGIKTIERYNPIIYYETLLGFEKIRGKSLFLPIENMLSNLGYRFFKIYNGNIIPTHYPSYSGNTLALPEKIKI